MAELLEEAEARKLNPTSKEEVTTIILFLVPTTTIIAVFILTAHAYILQVDGLLFLLYDIQTLKMLFSKLMSRSAC